MLLVYSLLTIPFIYGLLWVIVPKGNVVHEAIRIPFHLWKIRQLEIAPMYTEKVSFGKHFRQYLIICTPKAGITKDKIIMYFHGGAWMFGRPEMFYANASFFVERGYAVIMPSYRRPPLYRYASIREDLNLALAKANVIARKKKWHYSGWIMSGMSAGANLAALLALDRAELSQQHIAANQIDGLLLLGAPLDLNAMPLSIPLYAYAGSRQSPAFAKANVMNYLAQPGLPPLLAIHGTSDGLVPFPAAKNFIENYPKASVETYTIDKGTHLDCSGYLQHDKKMQKLIEKWLDKF